MTVKFLQDFNKKHNPNLCSRCKSCGLYRNQLPAYDLARHGDVIWLGLSAVKFGEGEVGMPLAANTNSGMVLADIEHPIRRTVSFYRTNIVKCLPLNEEKIRYPRESEMDKCFPNFTSELEDIKPRVVFLLGKQVASFVLKKYGKSLATLSNSFNYETFTIGSTVFIPVHHPSYILVYKRKQLELYKESIQRFIQTFVRNSTPYTFSHLPLSNKVGMQTQF